MTPWRVILLLAMTRSRQDEGLEPKRGTVVAIDGPAGAGKSTLAHELARRVRLPYVNTGMMYRALASRALALGVDPDDEAALASLVGEIRFDLGPSPLGEEELLIDGNLPAPALSSAEVEAVVSRVARHGAVRGPMRAEQRHLGLGGCVMEGRDIGTVVFPDADLKIFLLAEPVVRAQRRELERGGGGDVSDAVARRDALDGRTNPLVPAPDAHVLDTTALSREEVLAEALRLFEEAAGGSGARGGPR
jgi:CMP/dCMP kinase